MIKIPLTLVFMTSTKQHHGYKDVYLATLNHFDRQLPLSQIATKVAHVKVSPSEQILGDEMEAELVRRGFKVLKTVASWQRGLSHQSGYASDLLKVSLEPSIYANPYMLWLEDDSLMQANRGTLDQLLSRMTKMLDDSPDLLSMRLVRRGDERAAPIVSTSIDHFYSEHFNFNSPILRTRDFYLVNKMIEDNAASLSQIQIEMVWRLVFAPFSRSDLKHAVFWPDYAESVHLDVPDYPQLKVSLGL